MKLPEEIEEARKVNPNIRAFLVLNQLEPRSALSAAMRDALGTGAIDGAHMLSPMVVASAAGVGPFPREYVPWMALHGSLGLVPLIGATCLVAGRLMAGRNRFSSHFNRHHKAYGRTFIVIWLFTHLGGIFNAFFLR